MSGASSSSIAWQDDHRERAPSSAGDGQGLQDRRRRNIFRDCGASGGGGETEVQKSQLKDWMKPVEVPIPKFPGQDWPQGNIYREPYGVALDYRPGQRTLLLLIRPALAALAAGNTCILTLSEALPETTKALLELVRKYFDPQRRDGCGLAARNRPLSC